jgi:hypothetical protein
MTRIPTTPRPPAHPDGKPEPGDLAGDQLTGVVDGLLGHPEGLDLREAEEGAAAATAAEEAAMTDEEREEAEEAEDRPGLGFSPPR